MSVAERQGEVSSSGFLSPLTLLSKHLTNPPVFFAALPLPRATEQSRILLSSKPLKGQDLSEFQLDKDRDKLCLVDSPPQHSTAVFRIRLAESQPARHQSTPSCSATSNGPIHPLNRHLTALRIVLCPCDEPRPLFHRLTSTDFLSPSSRFSLPHPRSPLSTNTYSQPTSTAATNTATMPTLQL